MGNMQGGINMDLGAFELANLDKVFSEFHV